MVFNPVLVERYFQRKSIRLNKNFKQTLFKDFEDVEKKLGRKELLALKQSLTTIKNISKKKSNLRISITDYVHERILLEQHSYCYKKMTKSEALNIMILDLVDRRNKERIEKQKNYKEPLTQLDLDIINLAKRCNAQVVDLPPFENINDSKEGREFLDFVNKTIEPES